MTESRTRTRMKILAWLVALMFGALTTRLWFLQVLAAPSFSKLANENQLRLVPIEPLRGEILDRNGVELAGNRSTVAVVVDRQELGDQEEQVLFRLLFKYVVANPSCRAVGVQDVDPIDVCQLDPRCRDDIRDDRAVS